MAINKKALECLKVWYSIFCTIVDDKSLNHQTTLDKLYKLRDRIKRESPELEKMIKQMKN